MIYDDNAAKALTNDEAEEESLAFLTSEHRLELITDVLSDLCVRLVKKGINQK